MARHRRRRWIAIPMALVYAGLAVVFAWPAFETLRAWRDPALGGPEPASQAWRWHRALTPAYADWAVERRVSRAATTLGLDDISGTEWPLFGSVYYLRATENLDRAWQRAPHGERPADYARAAIDAAADLLADPHQAAWVKMHWGEDHLHRENVFYRMLVIDGLATQARLLGRTPHEALLRDQVGSLAAELDAAPSGLLADYPRQTFPADVAAVWHAIRRADAVLGSDHRAMADRALRGFTGAMAPTGELPPYAWFGDPPEPTAVRGSASAWLLHHAPFLWPDQARTWFDAHMRGYWQHGRWLTGYREFPRGQGDMFYIDVDAGPVLDGLGTSATAFGLGAARSMGAHAEARTLGLLAVALSWPLPNGRLLGPRLMSDLSDAPLLGEAAMLYNLTQPAAEGARSVEGAVDVRVPWIVPGIVVLQMLAAFACLLRALRIARQRRAD